LFRKTVADSNAPVQEKALDALLAFQRAADADASRCVHSAAKSFTSMLLIICYLQRFMELAPLRYAKEVCDSIVAKCLTGRPKTVEKAQAAFLLWVELEASEVFLVS
jgi:cytoskeleton-associated protein 5